MRVTAGMAMAVAGVAVAVSACASAGHPTAQAQVVTIHRDPLMTFRPDATLADRVLTSDEAFRRMAPQGHMAPEETATLGYLYDGANRGLVWAFTLPHSCPPGLGVGQGSSESPTPCNDAEWVFARARTGHFVLETWQVS